MRVAVLGAGGMLGHDLVATAPPDVEVLPFRHADLDITDPAAVKRLFAEHHPDVVINAAAYTAVDKAEEEPEIAERVNGWAPGVLGEAAKRAGSRVIHFSTDYVFDGTANEPYAEDAPTNPINKYGASKLMGEKALQASGAEALIIRTQWLFGMHGRSFPRTMWERAKARQPTRVVNDQMGKPTYTIDLAGVTWALLIHRQATLFDIQRLHLANAGRATWYEVAERVFSHARSASLLSPIASSDYAMRAPRPLRSVLDTSRFTSVTDRRFPEWGSGLKRFVHALTKTE